MILASRPGAARVRPNRRGYVVRDSDTPVLLIAGDVTVDWLLAAPMITDPTDLQVTYQWEMEGGAALSAQAGGAALLTELARELVGDCAQVDGPTIPAEVLTNPGDHRLPRTYSLWHRQPAAHRSRELAWRMDRFLGVQPGSDIGLASAPSGATPCCVVLDDANLGFRDKADLWPGDVREPGFNGEVILKMSAPIATGPLWEHLVAHHADRLTVCIAVDNLRKGDAAIGQPLSWERLAEEVVATVRAVPGLLTPARVVVSLGLAGAVVIAREGTVSVIFDPLHQEGDWERERPNSIPGLGTCLAAALAREVVQDQMRPDWTTAVMRGLIAGRAVHEAGYQPRGQATNEIGFPVAVAIEHMRAIPPPNDPFAIAPVTGEPDWQLLPMADDHGYQHLARRIVLEGDPAACQEIPVERMGAWTSIDRTEIESMRSLRNIMRQYLSQGGRTRPLSVAVFGPPGSGKSFAVKQMAKEWVAGGTRIEVIEMNVAQFGSPSDLAMALQRVRDAAVEQSLPLVFWDEFDSPFEGKELGWLARFLAPMQDGTFLEGGIARPIGPAIFIFAGGTHSTLASFKERSVTVPGAKASDFLSRLRGHVDILGPNPRDARDRGYVLRRALLLRAQLLGRNPRLLRGGRLSIDEGVLRAFLEAPTYVHGARSLEAIIEMSSISGRLRYERSSLPARHQLALHVDADAFLDLVFAGAS